MTRRGSNCGICEGANQPSHCVACVNLRIAEKCKFLKRSRQERDALKHRLEAEVDKIDVENRQDLRTERADRVAKLRDQVRKSKEQLEKNKLLRAQKERELEAGHSRLRSAKARISAKRIELLDNHFPHVIQARRNDYVTVSSELLKCRQKQFQILCRIFPLSQGDSADKGKGSKGKNLSQHVRIYGVPLPIGDDPSSVSPIELSASLGYMLHLVCFAASYLSSPLLYEGAFAASSSRMWQRASYWDSRSTCRSEEYPLFIPRKGARSKLVDKQGSVSGSGFLSLEKPGSLSRSKSSEGFEVESSVDKDVRQGLKLLKANILCICAVGFRMLSLPVPSNMSTFETFMELLSILKGSKTKRSNRPPSIRLDGSLVQSGFSSQIKDSEASLRKNKIAVISDFFGSKESPAVDEWDVIEHPVLPPPSQSEDVEHWTRAMFVDATK